MKGRGLIKKGNPLPKRGERETPQEGGAK